MISATGPRSFIDSIERERRRRLGDMQKVYEVDPTPALKERIEKETATSEKKLRMLRDAHERFKRLMELSDDQLKALNSSDRAEPLIGDPKLVKKIKERTMGEAEYLDLLYGPDPPAKQSGQ